MATTIIRNIKDSIDDFINVKNYGALGNAGLDWLGRLRDDSGNPIDLSTVNDDGPAIQGAINEAIRRNKTDLARIGSAVYIPAGVYVIKTPIYTYGMTIVGAGGGTVLVGAVNSFNISKAPKDIRGLLNVGGEGACIDNITLQYDSRLLSQNETEDDKILLYLYHPETTYITGNYPKTVAKGVAAGSRISNIFLKYCGTAVASYRIGKNDPALDCGYYSVHFDTIKVEKFVFRGFDLPTWGCTGSIFNNIYLNSEWSFDPYNTSKFPAILSYGYPWRSWVDQNDHSKGLKPQNSGYLPVDCGFLIGPGQYETNINQLNVEHLVLKNPYSSAISINGCSNVVIGSIHIEGIIPTLSTQSIFKIHNSSVSCSAITVCNSVFGVVNFALFRLGNTYAPFAPEIEQNNTNNYLGINMLSCAGLGVVGDPSQPITGIKNIDMYIFARTYNTDTGINESDPPVFQIDLKSFNYAGLTWGDSKFENDQYDKYKQILTPANSNIILGSQLDIVLPVLENTGTVAKPSFPQITNPQQGQLIMSTAGKVYVCSKATTPITWRPLN